MASSKPAVTPMMAQYLEIKSEYENALLFYRMGDFYELFFDDAKYAAEALDIALTKRGKHLGEDIPMCGVPVHSAEGYLLSLIRKGFRVAVCEQLENPAEAKKRGSKAVVKRGVVRLVTPGTLTEDSLLDARSHNFLCAYKRVRDGASLAWVDISTGALSVLACDPTRLGREIARLAPSEVLLPAQSDTNEGEIVSELGASPTELGPAAFDSDAGEKRLKSLFGVKSLDAFGHFSRADLGALGALIDYLDITQKGKLPNLLPPIRESAEEVMQIDAATRRNLELSKTLSGSKKGSLLDTIDRAVTAAGGRLLAHRLSSPSRNLNLINARQDAVEAFFNNANLRADLRDKLKNLPDIDRALSRLSVERAGPRDLAAIRDGLATTDTISELLQNKFEGLIAESVSNLEGFDDLQALLDQALVADPPLLARDGGFIAEGFDSELDQTRKLRDEGRSVIAGLQSKYADQTGIQSLKIKHNNVLGYFIETTATHAEKMLSAPLSENFIHRQTTANAVRFTTIELSELETRILNAAAHAKEIENRHYSSLCATILGSSAQISLLAKSLAEIDLFAAFAELAASENYCRPELTNDTRFVIEKGRHPVVEKALLSQGDTGFIANDCDLADEKPGAAIWLLTGPNMAGKSTFLRQNALIALLAQIGSFVPAARAQIGIVSQLFSRVGASDDLARGRSTFMVEMVETAAILNQADENALVILDEIGRGTATYDGLSIAWATLEYLHEKNRCRALFATHYHELCELSESLKGVENATIAVREWEGEVVFMHEVIKGSADRSYGVQVAKLAGLPKAVTTRAETILKNLEEDKANKSVPDLPLFSLTPTPTATPEPSAVEEILKGIHPDDLSAKQALDLIYELKAKLND